MSTKTTKQGFQTVTEGADPTPRVRDVISSPWENQCNEVAKAAKAAHDTPEGRTKRAEDLFREAIEHLRASEARVERANQAQYEADRDHAIVKQWHRFARDQYLERTFYAPETDQQGHGPVRGLQEWAKYAQLTLPEGAFDYLDEDLDPIELAAKVGKTRFVAPEPTKHRVSDRLTVTEYH